VESKWGAGATSPSNDPVIHALHRFTYGPTKALVTDVRKTGLDYWFERQLDYLSIPDTKVAEFVSSKEIFTYIHKDMNYLWPLAEAEGDMAKGQIFYFNHFSGRVLHLYTLTQQAQSERQIYEMMVEFWHDHFNITTLGDETKDGLLDWHTNDFNKRVIREYALTNFEDILGIENFKDFLGQDEDIQGGFFHNIYLAFSNLGVINIWSVFLGLLTFVLAKYLLKLSIYIPGPVMAMGTATLLAATVLADKNIVLVRDLYGSIPNNFFKLQMPFLPAMNGGVIVDIVYFVISIVFVSGVESVLCSSMADRLAKNDRTPFNPDKEFFGQGLVQIITPLVQGFPCTGALARTATSIKAGATTPLAGYFKAVLKLMMAFYLAQYLELIPMACIGGILVWVASNMIKPSEIKEIKHSGKFEFSMMIYTAVMVPTTDFLTGVLSALVIYFIVKYFFKNREKNNAQN
jgi:hypothetical protein